MMTNIAAQRISTPWIGAAGYPERCQDGTYDADLKRRSMQYRHQGHLFSACCYE